MTPTKHTPVPKSNDLDNLSSVLGPLYDICVNTGNVIGNTISDLIDVLFDDDDKDKDE